MHLLWHGLLDLLYPPRCEACGNLRRAALCEECLAAIERIEPPMCELCGEPFDPLAQSAPRCADCRGKRKPFTLARSACYYTGPLAEAIKRYKYHCQMVLWRPLGELLVEAMAQGKAEGIEAESVDIICAVPLHSSRLRERGFNQSELLAEVVAEHLEKPLRPLLARTRATLPQVDLPAASRAVNVRDAFTADLHEVIKGQRVLLIDDLFTTGATMTECARTLMRAEAQEVRIYTLARPLPLWKRVQPADAATPMGKLAP